MKLTERELSEIKLALFYEKECNHGTAGHNRLMLIAKMAKELGIELDSCGDTLTVPSGGYIFPGMSDAEVIQMLSRGKGEEGSDV